MPTKKQTAYTNLGVPDSADFQSLSKTNKKNNDIN